MNDNIYFNDGSAGPVIQYYGKGGDQTYWATAKPDKNLNKNTKKWLEWRGTEVMAAQDTLSGAPLSQISVSGLKERDGIIITF